VGGVCYSVEICEADCLALAGVEVEDSEEILLIYFITIIFRPYLCVSTRKCYIFITCHSLFQEPFVDVPNLSCSHYADLPPDVPVQSHAQFHPDKPTKSLLPPVMPAVSALNQHVALHLLQN